MALSVVVVVVEVINFVSDRLYSFSQRRFINISLACEYSRLSTLRPVAVFANADISLRTGSFEWGIGQIKIALARKKKSSVAGAHSFNVLGLLR